MAGLGSLGAKLAELEAKLPGIVQSLGVNPSLQKLFQLSVHTPEGAAAGERLAPEMVDRLNKAPVIMRRRSLADLLGNGELQNVHTSGRTGSAAGTKRSIEARSQVEPSMFGGYPTYGHVSEDPLLPARSKLEMSYPDKGAIIKPDSMISQYGRYGFEPRDKSKLTFTIGDSLDSSKWYGLSEFIGQPGAEKYGAHQTNAAIGALTDHFKQLKAQRAEELGLHHTDGPYGNWYAKEQDRTGWTRDQMMEANQKERELLDQFRDEFPDFGSLLNYQGYHGIEGGRTYGGAPLEAYPRLLPRRFGEQGPPLAPFEQSHVGEIPKMINGNPDYGYVEAQGHGLTTQDIGKVYDYGIDPSTATEKKLRKLGIEYIPAAAPDNALGQVRDFTKMKPSRSELADFIESLGPEVDGRSAMSLPDVLRDWKTNPMDLPKVADHYAQGGYVYG
jgi:hypothetical protein